jgi:Tol biopolymer transport system component
MHLSERLIRQLLILCLGAILISGCSGGAVGGLTSSPGEEEPAESPILPTATPTATITTEATPALEPTQTSAPAQTPAPGPPPLSGASKLAFSVVQRISGRYRSLGIFLLEIASEELELMSDSDLIIHGVSPYGGRMLVSQQRELYVMGLDGSDPRLMTEGYQENAQQGAYWHPKLDRLIFLASDGTEYGIYLANGDGSDVVRITQSGVSAIEIYPSLDETRIYWASGRCYPSGDCTLQDYMMSSIDGSRHDVLPAGIHEPAGSPMGDMYACVREEGEGEVGFYLVGTEGSDSQRISVGGDHFLDYAWSPDGSRIALIVADRSGYSGRILAYRYFLVSSEDGSLQAIPGVLEANIEVWWSPDGQHLVLTGTEQGAGGYTVTLRTVDLQTQRVRRFDLSQGLDKNIFPFIPQISWVP